MEILSDLTVDETVNSVNLTSLLSLANNNKTDIQGKANTSDLAVGNYDGVNYGRLQEVRFNTTEVTVSFVFQGGTVVVEVSGIAI